jgi:hypothetical protein
MSPKTFFEAIMKPHRLDQVRFFSIHSPLLEHRRDVTSQNGEDGILEHIFTKIPKSESPYCVEFGAWDGKHLSNCYNLIKNDGWSGLLIEANKQKFQQLQKNYEMLKNVKCVNTFVEFEGPNSLDNIMERSGAPVDFDLLSIDIDGADYFIWESLTKFRPKVVVIEFNPSVPNDVIFVQAKDMKVNQGSSLLALIFLGKQKGYELICCTSCNAIFVLSSFYPNFSMTSNHITKMFTPACDGRIFHGYDSEIHIVGMSKLLWSNISIESGDFQVLPASLRRFSDSQTK